MQYHRSFGRSALLTLSLLSACAAAEPSGASTEPRARPGSGDSNAAGASAAFLLGRFASSEGDIDRAADEFMKALSLDASSAEVRQQAFAAALLAGRSEAVKLARMQPSSDATAQLVLGNAEAKAGDWEAAERRFAGLSRQGPVQILQPLLLAWAQFGAGRPEVAQATLRPYVEGTRYRAIYAFHAAMMADLASRPGEAARLYKMAQAEFGSLNLDLARVIASWQTRQGHADEAKQTLEAFAKSATDFAIALPRLQAEAATRQIRRATDGMAAAYLAMAVAQHQQDANDMANVLMHLALDVRPDFSAARLMASDLADQDKRTAAALAALTPVADSDPLAPVIDLRRAALQDRLGNTDEALRIAAKLAAAYPARSEPWALQGDLLRGKHRYAEAVVAYDKAVGLLPQPLGQTDWPMFYERGVALERSHDWQRAEADFQHALQLSPDEPFVLNYLAYSWTEQGYELTRARQMITKAAEQRPNDGAILDSLGWVLLRQGDVPGGVKWLEKAVELESEDSTINGHLGDAYWAAGRKLEANYQWQRALNLKPEPEDLPKLQAKLHEARQALGMPAPAAMEKTTQ